MTVLVGLCPECGEVPVEEHRPGRWERFRYWMVNGGSAPSTLTCPNGHEWARSTAVMLFRARAGSRWLWLPIEVARAILAERRMTPTPMTYLIAAGVGLAIGLILELVIGWTWWVVAAAFVLLVWLLFLGSVFRRPRRDLRHVLLGVVNPERAAARDIQRLEEAVRSGSLTGYEVVGWEGDKSIGGWGGDHAVVRSLTLRHGVLEDGAESVEVTTHGGDESATVLHWLQEKLESELIQAVVPRPGDLGPEDAHAWHVKRARAIRDAEPPAWRPAAFRLGGKTIPGQIASSGDHWVAFVRTDTAVVEMVGYKVDPGRIELSPIVSLDGFVS